MKKILVLGAGFVAGPLVRYLLEQPGYRLTLADMYVEKAEELIAGHERGSALLFDIEDRAALDKLVSGHDVTISLLPPPLHPIVAESCVGLGTPLVTSSYVSEEMEAFDGPARAAGITLLNEIGLDPGIDHMSAMKIIRSIREAGGTVTKFHSYCGGLPAPEADTNPWGYKFSWSPRGVIAAGRNDARFRENGEEVEVPGPELFGRHWPVAIQGYGELEAYLNRDSIPYIDAYGLKGVRNMLRGTLRNGGWCFTMKKLADLDYFGLDRANLAGLTIGDLTCRLAGVDGGGDVAAKVAGALDVNPHTDAIRRMEWLGLFGDTPVPADAESPIDVLCHLMLEKLVYENGECDLCVMQHEFEAEYPDGRREETISTLVETGIPGGDSAMSRSVGLPAAIGARLLLEGKISDTGVLRPLLPSIYEPVLDELAAKGKLVFRETTRAL